MSSQDVKDAMVKSVYKFKDLKPEEEKQQLLAELDKFKTEE